MLSGLLLLPHTTHTNNIIYNNFACVRRRSAHTSHFTKWICDVRACVVKGLFESHTRVRETGSRAAMALSLRARAPRDANMHTFSHTVRPRVECRNARARAFCTENIYICIQHHTTCSHTSTPLYAMPAKHMYVCVSCVTAKKCAECLCETSARCARSDAPHRRTTTF